MNATFIVEHTYMSLSVGSKCVNPFEMVLLSQGIWCSSQLMVGIFQDMKKQSDVEGNECDLPRMKSMSPTSIELCWMCSCTYSMLVC